jgi:5'(3')-deoxyribonucleotidase
MTPALQFVNDRFGTDYTLQHVVHSDARHWMQPHHHDLFMEFVMDPKIYGHLPTLPYAIETILELSTYDCNIVSPVTGRPTPCVRLGTGCFVMAYPTRTWR